MILPGGISVEFADEVHEPTIWGSKSDRPLLPDQNAAAHSHTRMHAHAQSDMHLLCGLCYTAVEDCIPRGPIFRMAQNKLQN